MAYIATEGDAQLTIAHVKFPEKSDLLRNMQTESAPLYPKGICNTQDVRLVQNPPAALLLGPDKTETTCPFCYSLVRTGVKYVTTSRTHITAALFSFICCCCCIPYCCSSAKNTDHYCPSCHKYLGTYEK